MKFAALVGVKDEVELIAACVSHLRRIGVDQIVVSDYGSTDGTLDVLADESRAGDLTVESVRVSTVADYSTWSVRETALAASTEADWVVFQDADEFWIPASGSLRTCRGLDVSDVLAVDRFNVALTSRQQSMPPAAWFARLEDLLVFTTQPPHFKQYVEEHPEVPFITLMPGAKMMARPRAIAVIAPGSHDAHGPTGEGPIRRFAAPDLLIAHVPFSTLGRFARKVDNVRAELADNAACYYGDLAWHWKRWAALPDPDAIRREFTRQMLEDDELNRLRNSVVRSVQEIFAERLGANTDAHSRRSPEACSPVRGAAEPPDAAHPS